MESKLVKHGQFEIITQSSNIEMKTWVDPSFRIVIHWLAIALTTCNVNNDSLVYMSNDHSVSGSCVSHKRFGDSSKENGLFIPSASPRCQSLNSSNIQK